MAGGRSESYAVYDGPTNLYAYQAANDWRRRVVHTQQGHMHGMTVAEAKPRLAAFIERCARNDKLCIRVVHGKGLGSGERGPVLKMSVNRWLRQWDAVLAFVSARQVDGGTGALYVLLRKL